MFPVKCDPKRALPLGVFHRNYGTQLGRSWTTKQQDRQLVCVALAHQHLTRVQGKLYRCGDDGRSRSVLQSMRLTTQGVSAALSEVKCIDKTSDSEKIKSIKGQLEGIVEKALSASFPDGQWGKAVVAPTNNPKFGDYQCNNAMPLFSKIKGTEGAPKSPRALAELIVNSLPPHEMVEDVSIAGPGFINFRLDQKFIARHVGSLFDKGIQSWAPEPVCNRAVVDFSSPNVAKEMHVGHLRSTIIGDALCRNLEYSGVQVKRLNHVGDWGTQFGMLIQHMEENGLRFDAPVSDLQQLYKDAKVRFDEEADFKKRAQEAVVKLQSGSEDSLQRWKMICEASRKEFNAIYDKLGIEIEERGESFYNPKLEGLVESLKEAGVAELSEGAMCIFVEGSDIPLIIQKSDGGFGYATTDMCAIKQRVEEEKADWIIYVTDNGQSQHFKGIFAAAKKCGLIPEEGLPRVDHVGFGLVLGEDGKRLRTRSGDVVRLADLLDEAVMRCKEQIVQRQPEYAAKELELVNAAESMGYAAIKYADLKQNISTDYEFSFDRMLDLKGNTAVYLQYAHARICSILSKIDGDDNEHDGLINVTSPSERALLIALSQFPEAIEDVIDELAPNRLCEYLYNLTGKFTDFYGECKVVGSEHQASRVLICRATLLVIRKCFDLLGMKPLNRL